MSAAVDAQLHEIRKPRVALVLGGGGACGLAHVGVLEVLEDEGVVPDCIVGTSMGGLIGALRASGLSAGDIRCLARGFAFPRLFVLGRIAPWDWVFRPAIAPLEGLAFSQVSIPLLLTATDVEAGVQMVLHRGDVLSAARATCAVPGILPAVNLRGRWLVDGGLMNQLPVDVAWMAEPDVVVAVNVGVTRPRTIPALHSSVAPWLMALGRFVPNPATAKLCFEVLARAAEITVARQAALSTAMTGPELLLEPDVSDVGIRDFHRLDHAIAAGRDAARQAMPQLRALLDKPPVARAYSPATDGEPFDPVCGMVISASRARATVVYAGARYRFCSANCRDAFDQNPTRYLPLATRAWKSNAS